MGLGGRTVAVAATIAVLVGAYFVSPLSDPTAEPDAAGTASAALPASLGLDPSGPSEPAEEGAHDHHCPDAGDQVDGGWRCVTENAILVSEWSFTTEPDEAQEAAADRFVAETSEAIARYADVEAARADGYVFDDRTAWVETTAGTEFADLARSELASGAVAHLVNERLANDGVAADPEHPEALMYATNGDRYVLVGAMFIAPLGTDGPQVGGPMTTWHIHNKGDVVCWDGSAAVGFARLQPGDPRYEPSGGCARGTALEESPQMLHVWLDQETTADAFDSEMSTAQARELVS